MSGDLRPLVLYFGTAQRPEFYAGLLGGGSALGLLLDEDTPHKLEPPEFDFVERFAFSQGAEAIARRIEEIRGRYRLECVLNVDETLVPLWSEVCALLGLRGMTPAAATAVRSKSEMRRRFAERIGIAYSARSHVVTDEAGLLRFAAGTGYPVILKPGNLWGSYFVSLCADADELTAAYRQVRDTLPEFSEQQRVAGVPVEILAEEYLPGTNHSVECLVLDGEVWTTPVIDVVTGTDLGGTDFHHFARVTATRLTADQQERMRALAGEAVRALDVDRGLLHVEFVQGPDGPRLIEAGGRPGANRAPLLREAFGINIIAGYRDVMRGVRPQVTPAHDGAAAVVTPYPAQAGALRSYRTLDAIRALSSTVQVDTYKQVGDVVRPRHEGVAAPVRIEMRAASPEQLSTDLRELTALCEELFEVDPERDDASVDASAEALGDASGATG
ncbi:acetyl-CoA carboxylase biotin carboxylase subunit family protein [Streptomyces virginiae]|uniref:ATP-grasp domain-containing protein n=1 Tax=Streptomyces virginiae TaxID=1961 RepID=UPI003654B6CD